MISAAPGMIGGSRLHRRDEIAIGLRLAGFGPATRGDVDQLMEAATQPGRLGVRASINSIVQLPLACREMILRELYASHANRHGWQLALLYSWKTTSLQVQRAAGDLDTLRQWFSFANYPSATLPWVKARICMSDLPETQTAYRGGRGDPQELAQGLSWTPSQAVAAAYAWEHPYGLLPGAPVILQRVVAREDVLLSWGVHVRELVVTRPCEPIVDTDDAAEIERLFESTAEQRAERERAKEAEAALPEEDFWGDWDG